MTPLQPVPDPDDDLDFENVDRDDDQNQTPAKPCRGRRGRRRTGPTRGKNPLKETDIVTPAPANYNRDVPAGDTDDQGLLTKWDHITDRVGAATTILELCNAHEKLMELIEELIAVEDRLRGDLMSLNAVRERARRHVETVSAQLTATSQDGGSEREIAILRKRLQLARHYAAEVTAHARQLARVTQQIESTPDRVYRAARIVIGHHDRDRQIRSDENQHRGGIWATPEDGLPGCGLPSWGIDGFVQRYGELPIPSKDEIVEHIEKLREAVHRETRVGEEW